MWQEELEYFQYKNGLGLWKESPHAFNSRQDLLETRRTLNDQSTKVAWFPLLPPFLFQIV